jgi:histidine triad (HIT) family protein
MIPGDKERSKYNAQMHDERDFRTYGACREESALYEPFSRRICGPEQHEYAKPDPEHTFRGRLDGTRAKADEIVYQDDDVFAFRHNVDPSAQEWWEIHVVIIPKRWVPTLLDIGLGDDDIWNKLIAGIQKVALTLNLHEQGFLIRMGVLPPYQHTEHVHIHILAGKHSSEFVDGPVSDVH